MFPSRMTIDSVTAELWRAAKEGGVSLDELEQLSGKIMKHPETTPAHRAAIASALVKILKDDGASRQELIDQPNIISALQEIGAEAHPSVSAQRIAARAILSVITKDPPQNPDTT